MIAAYLEFVPPGGLRADLSDPPYRFRAGLFETVGSILPALLIR
jgi:hypothetical protein